jgi:hypothetical protein
MEISWPELIKKFGEALSNSLDWAAENWRSKDWFKRLVLLGSLLTLILASIFSVLNLISRYNLPLWLLGIVVGLFVVIALIFVFALIIRIRAIRLRPAQPPPDRRSPIKGLLAFDAADEEVFARLQRHNELLECAQAITDHDFRFGILSADSGNGKTSFLQAGLLPALRKRGHRCVYVKFAELDSIKQALSGRLPPDTPPEATLSELLRSAARPEDKEAGPLVLLLDQFEQFFVQKKRKKDREPFIRQLSEWYNGDSTTQAKLLISIRSDFRGRLDEMQKAMGYSLGPQQIFNLERFTPEEAAEIFRVLAESAQLECDRGFIEEMTARELASPDDGLISPVDIQILAWMITLQSVGEERAFTRRAFQKLGGVERLLERFLTRALEALDTPRRQAATKVLLALTDLERNTRAGALTLDDLRRKLGGAVSDSELRDAAEWLTRGDVRLAVLVKRDHVEDYELAHERLIPALRRIANKELTEADRANLLLDRRANEWQGSNREKRYLFSSRELWLVDNQAPFLQWGQNRGVKQALIAASRRRFRFRLGLAAILVLLPLIAWPIWRLQRVQLQYITKYIDWNKSSKSMADDDALIQIAKAYATMKDFPGALGVAERVSNESSKAFALERVARVMDEFGERQPAIDLLKQAQGVAETITNENDKAVALKGVAEAMAEFGEKRQAIDLLKQAQGVAETITDERHKEFALGEVAAAMAEVGAKQRDKDLLKQAQVTAEKTSDERYRVPALKVVSKAAAAVGDFRRAHDVASKQGTKARKLETMALILETWARSKDPRLADKIWEN